MEATRSPEPICISTPRTRYQKQRGNVTKGMTPFRRVVDSLPSHDYSMHHAGPYGEPDDAFVLNLVAMSNAQGRCEMAD
jgi:hypothetical protein